MIAQAAPDPGLLVELYRSIDFVQLLFAAAVLGVAYAANRFVDGAIDRFVERAPRYRLVAERVGSFLRLGFFFGATYLLLLVLLRANRTLLYGVGGTLLVAVGLGLKGTVSSLLAGIVLLVDRPFQVGDQVEFQGTYGEVTQIGLRAVRIWTRGDRRVTIPNHRFLTEAVKSTSAGGLEMTVELEFWIAGNEDHELARRLVRESCMSSRFTHVGRPVEVQVQERNFVMGFATVLTCRTHIFDARNDGAFETDVTERVRRAFRRHGIQRPYLRTYEIQSDERGDVGSETGRFVRD